MNIQEYDYPLPEDRIAKFPPARREDAKLLVVRGGEITHTTFGHIGELLPDGALVVFNNTKVVRARLVMHKPAAEDSRQGARIEVFCLEPHEPADYERAFAARGTCRWRCMVGNAKKWKTGFIEAEGLRAWREESAADGTVIVRFEWDGAMTFGELLEKLGRTPIPPYLCRESTAIDTERYQTVYSRIEGSVAAPTAGLHFTPEIIAALPVPTAEVTLHVGAGTFLPVKTDDPRQHTMHTEHFEVGLPLLDALLKHQGKIAAVGTTTVRTLESLTALGRRVLEHGDPRFDEPVGQWELYNEELGIRNEELGGCHPERSEGSGGDRATLQILRFAQNDNNPIRALKEWMTKMNLSKIKASTQIMIMPGFEFGVVNAMITNFHQPKSTLLLLVSAFTSGRWREIYDYALDNDFRFLSYGDSSFIVRS